MHNEVNTRHLSNLRFASHPHNLHFGRDGGTENYKKQDTKSTMLHCGAFAEPSCPSKRTIGSLFIVIGVIQLPTTQKFPLHCCRATKYSVLLLTIKGKGKGHSQQAVEMAQGGPGRLRPRNT